MPLPPPSVPSQLFLTHMTEWWSLNNYALSAGLPCGSAIGLFSNLDYNIVGVSCDGHEGRVGPFSVTRKVQAAFLCCR